MASLRGFVPLLAVLVTLGSACSSGGSPGAGSDGGSGNDTDIASTHPDGFVAATLGPSAAGSGCPFASATPWVTVGAPNGGKPATTETNSNVTITCSVVTSGKGFDVSLSAVEKTAGASFTLTSAAGQGAVTVAGGQVDAAFTSAQAASPYEQNDCVLSFTYEGSPVPDSPSVFPGRIWAHVSCPQALDQGGTDTCDAEADFLFEECSQ